MHAVFDRQRRNAEKTCMNLLEPATLVLGVVVTALMLVVVAYFARATRRRIAGALIGAIPIIPMVMLYDRFAAQQGWWHYPSVTTATAPLAWYIAAALWYGAALGLVGWRAIRRFATRGLLVFVVVFALFGVTRDYLYSVTTRLIVFGPGLVPLIADLFAYASAAAMVQLLMYWIAGPAQADPLARMPQASAARKS
jgi:CDP-diglyceride synthetase